jgi:hypothetical protein
MKRIWKNKTEYRFLSSSKYWGATERTDWLRTSNSCLGEGLLPTYLKSIMVREASQRLVAKLSPLFR